MGKYHGDGKAVDKPVAPFQLVFKPNPALTTMCQGAELIGEAFGCFDKIEAGTELYTIWAQKEPEYKANFKGGELTKIGTMTSDSQFILSQFFDYHVQFRHVFWATEIGTLGTSQWEYKTKDIEFRREDGA